MNTQSKHIGIFISSTSMDMSSERLRLQETIYARQGFWGNDTIYGGQGDDWRERVQCYITIVTPIKMPWPRATLRPTITPSVTCFLDPYITHTDNNCHEQAPAILALMDALKDADDDARQRAAQALIAIREAAIPALLDTLKGTINDVRRVFDYKRQSLVVCTDCGRVSKQNYDPVYDRRGNSWLWHGQHKVTTDAPTATPTPTMIPALDYDHNRGIIHRDIKPSSIMIDTEDNAFLPAYDLWMDDIDGAARWRCSGGGQIEQHRLTSAMFTATATPGTTRIVTDSSLWTEAADGDWDERMPLSVAWEGWWQALQAYFNALKDTLNHVRRILDYERQSLAVCMDGGWVIRQNHDPSYDGQGDSRLWRKQDRANADTPTHTIPPTPMPTLTPIVTDFIPWINNPKGNCDEQVSVVYIDGGNEQLAISLRDMAA